MEAKAPEFQWGNFDVDRGFRCHVQEKSITDEDGNSETYDIADCLMPLPVWNNGEFERGEYRWRPGDRKRILQYGYIGNIMGDGDDNVWVPLGSVEFLGGISLTTAAGALLSTAATMVAMLY